MCGIVLLETLLAMTLFVATAAVVLGAMNASAENDGDLALQATALDRAESVFSRLQMGILPITDSGPNPCHAPFEQWTWQIITTASDTGDIGGTLQHVQVIIRNDQKNYQLDLAELMTNPATPPGAGAAAVQGGSP